MDRFVHSSSSDPSWEFSRELADILAVRDDPFAWKKVMEKLWHTMGAARKLVGSPEAAFPKGMDSFPARELGSESFQGNDFTKVFHAEMARRRSRDSISPYIRWRLGLLLAEAFGADGCAGLPRSLTQGCAGEGTNGDAQLESLLARAERGDVRVHWEIPHDIARFLLHAPSAPAVLPFDQAYGGTMHWRSCNSNDFPDMARIDVASSDKPWGTAEVFMESVRANVNAVRFGTKKHMWGFILSHHENEQVLRIGIEPGAPQAVENMMKKYIADRFMNDKTQSLAAFIKDGDVRKFCLMHRLGFGLDRYDDDSEEGRHLLLRRYKDRDTSHREILIRAFGPSAENIAGTQYCSPSALAARVFSAAGTDLAHRRDVVHAFRTLIYAEDRHVTAAVLREGWRVIGDIQEVTHAEYTHRIRPNIGTKTKPESTELRSLAEAIGCEYFADQLDNFRSTKNGVCIDKGDNSIEIAAIHCVYAGLLRYPYGTHAERARLATADIVGTPRHAVKHRAPNCFTGPWIMAAMLLRCGLPPDRMFLAEATYPKASAAGHNALVIRTCDNDIIFADFGYRKIIHPLLAKYAKTSLMESALKAMVLDNEKREVTVEFKDDEVEKRKLPLGMRLTPLFSGVAAVALLHAGTHCDRKEDSDAAELAYALGLTEDPGQPNLHYRAGVMALRKGDLDTADREMRYALEINPSLHYVHFHLGEVALARGDAAAARKEFEEFLESKCEVFDDHGTLKAEAEVYVHLKDEEMLAYWRGQIEK